jgi:hypothetical protein
MSDNSNGITPPVHSFAGLPVCTRLEELVADIAIIGLHYVSPYRGHQPVRGSARAGYQRFDGRNLRPADHQFHRHNGPQRTNGRMI